MKRASAMIFGLLLGGAVSMGVGCSAIVTEYDTSGCAADPPRTCTEIGAGEAAARGCCTAEGDRVYFCDDAGVVQNTDCGDRVCDYDPDLGIMTCVE